MPPGPLTPPAYDTSTTRGDVVAALREVQRAIRAVIEALPGRLTRPAHLATAVGISRTLAWRIWKMAFPDGEIPSTASMPGAAGFDVFVRAAERAGAAKQIIDDAELSLQQLQAAMRTHAGDKSGSDILLASLTGSSTDDGHVTALRREAFRGCAYMLGVRARSIYTLFVPHLCNDTGTIAAASVTGFFGVQRSRSETRWLLSWTRTTRDFESIASLRYEPLSPSLTTASLTDRSPLLDEFCSQPIPDIRRFPRPNRLGGTTYEDELMPGPVGLTGASDIVFGQVLRGIPHIKDDREDMLLRRVETPTELYTIDLALPAELHDGRMPEFTFYMNAHEDASYLRDDDRDAVPVPERLRHMGHMGMCESPGLVPRFADMRRRVFELLGRRPEEFEVYRLEMRYPPVPSTPVIRFQRPAR